MADSGVTLSRDVKHDAQLVIRLSKELLERVDSYAKRFETESGFAISRADVVRKLLTDALTAAETVTRKKR